MNKEVVGSTKEVKETKTNSKSEKEIKAMTKELKVGSVLLMEVKGIVKKFKVTAIEEKAVAMEDLEANSSRKYLRTVVESAFRKQTELAKKFQAQDDPEDETGVTVEEEKPKKGSKAPAPAKGKDKKAVEEEPEDDDDEEEEEEEPEDDDDEEEDEDDLETQLNKLSLGQLKRIARDLGTPKSELFERDEADLITIILDCDEKKTWKLLNQLYSQEVSKPVVKSAKGKEKDTKGKKEKNGKAKYWENEDPITCEMEENEIRFYEEAGRFQLYGKYLDKDTDEYKLAKAVTVKTDELTNKEAMKFIANVVYAMGGAVTDNRIHEIIASLEDLNKEVNPEDYILEEKELMSFDLDKLTAMAKGLNCKVKTGANKAENKKLLVKAIMKAQAE